jgi:hypothetical protein
MYWPDITTIHTMGMIPNDDHLVWFQYTTPGQAWIEDAVLLSCIPLTPPDDHVPARPADLISGQRHDALEEWRAWCRDMETGEQRKERIGRTEFHECANGEGLDRPALPVQSYGERGAETQRQVQARIEGESHHHPRQS